MYDDKVTSEVRSSGTDNDAPSIGEKMGVFSDDMTSEVRSPSEPDEPFESQPPVYEQPTEGHAIGVGYLILTMRELAATSQRALARAAGTSQGAIARIESGAHVPSLPALIRIADTMGLHLVLGLATPAAANQDPAHVTLEDLALVGTVTTDPLDGLPCFRVLREPPPWASYSM